MKTNGSGQTSHGWGDTDAPEGWIGPNPWDHPVEPLNHILDTTKIPPHERPWLIKDWIPLLETTGLGGPGGKGKTLLAQMLATASPLGSEWLGLPVAQTKAALVLCEDRSDDVLWRQRDINRRYRSAAINLANRLRIYPRRDNLHNYLAVFDRDDELHETTFFSQLLTDLKTFADGQPLLTVLDTRTDVFWGKQNDERHARLFVRRICDQIARETNGATILIYQPSLTGMREQTGTSGSVQWDAAFRARLYLDRYIADTKDNDDPKRRTLTLLKANHAEEDKTLDLRWDQGIFIRQEEFDANTPAYQIAAHAGHAQNIFRSFFPDAAKRAPYLSAKDQSPYYAPKKIATAYRLSPTKNKTKISTQDLDRAMWQLIDAKEFEIAEERSSNRTVDVIRKRPQVV